MTNNKYSTKINSENKMNQHKCVKQRNGVLNVKLTILYFYLQSANFLKRNPRFSF